MSKEIKRLNKSWKFLTDNGFLFEINRKILHPFGMALEIIVNEETGEITPGGVWDYRDDPEGILFDEDALELGRKKVERYMTSIGQKQLYNRVKLTGFHVQPIKKIKM